MAACTKQVVSVVFPFGTNRNATHMHFTRSGSTFFLVLCLLTTNSLLTWADDGLLDKYRKAAIEKWAEDIHNLEQLDQQEADPDKGILFVGSSSIRLWDTMADDMAPWPTIRRGYGGAKLSDLVIFIDRLVQPHNFEALIIFVANDITGDDDDQTPAEVLVLYQTLIKRIRQHHPTQPIAFIEITPTSSRFKVWPEIQRANALIEQWSETQPNLHYVATSRHFLDESGKPNDALFIDDRLHLNPQGYRLWSRLLKQSLSNILPEHPAARP